MAGNTETYPRAIDTLAKFAERKPRIFVGVCAFGDFSPEAFTSFVVWWGATCARYRDRFELHFGITARKEQYRGRNALVRGAEQMGADYLLMIDDDQTPHVTPDLLGQFADFGAPVMGGLYFQKGELYHPVLMHEEMCADGKIHFRFYRPEEVPTEPTTVDVAGHGCMWVDMDIYARLKEPHHWPFPHEVCFLPQTDMGLDVHFCHRVRHELDEEVWFLPGCHVGHISNERKVVTKDSRPAQSIIDATPEATKYWNTVMSRLAEKQAA
jgi:hypothetical protein